MKYITDENRKKIVDALFYIALTIELVLMIVEKSEISFSYESYVFRVTFLLTLLAVLFMKHDKKEWIFIAAIWAVSAVSYYMCGKNDMLRVVTFLMAARDIDLKKAMKYTFYVCIVGFTLIALLACAGIMGDMIQVADYGRGEGEEARYVFGFGHPNTLFGSMFVLLLMWLWIYGKKAGILPYLVMIVSSVIITLLTKSRTSAVILAATILLAIVFRLFPKLAAFKVFYILETIVSPVICIVTAVLAAGWTGAMYCGDNFWDLEGDYWKIETRFNYRMSSIYYEAANRDAVLSRWKLFSAHGTDSYFDMGWVRLFYWYGIIPVAILVVALLAVIYVCYKKQDIRTLIIIFALSVYTIVEATFVTRYIGRDFFLLIAGVYLGYYFKNKGETDVRES